MKDIRFETINGTLCRMVEPELKDGKLVIGYPVVEGSAEWALYQMMQGKMVIPQKCFTPYRMNDQGKVFCLDSRGTIRCFGNINDFMEIWGSCNTWQIHEPEPKYKVGDFVKYDVDTYLRVIEPSGKEKTLCKTLSGVIVYPYTSCLTKASPSEVVVDFGSGIKGTIVGCSNVMPIVKVLNGVDWIASIMISALDAQTRELVESLLKAQEEK